MFGITTIARKFTWQIAALVLCAGSLLTGTTVMTGCGSATDTDTTNADLGTPSTDSVQALVSPIPPPAAPTASIAVVDINQVAMRIGLMERIGAMVDEKESESRQRFALLQQKFQREYNAAALQAGDEPSPQDEARLLSLQEYHMQQLTAQWKGMQQETQDFHAELKKQFLDSVRPIAAAVAKSKQIPTVLTTSQVFSIEENCDITDEVANQMRQILIESAANPAAPQLR